MARQSPEAARQQPRPAHDPSDPRDNPQRRPEDAMDDREPRESETRSGVTSFPESREPSAASPTTTPHTVLGKEAPPEAYDPDAIARKEAAERGEEVTPPRDREQGVIAQEMEGDRAARRDIPLRFGMVVLAILVVLLLVWAL